MLASELIKSIIENMMVHGDLEVVVAENLNDFLGPVTNVECVNPYNSGGPRICISSDE